MLYLSRKIGESIIINNNIELTVVEVRGKAVKLGFTFPSNASVLRKEVHVKISEENQAAALGGGDLLEEFFLMDDDTNDESEQQADG